MPAAKRLRASARRGARYILAALRGLQMKHSLIGDVRGEGMFFGVELVRDLTKERATEETHRVVNGVYERGVLICRVGPRHNILKIRPPMPFSKANADQLILTLDDVLVSL